MNIKEKLLNTNMFLDNIYLNKYIDIVSNENNTNYTERHHIIPKSYFKINRLKIDNSKENIVKLSYYNHILAHYYLSFCTIGKLKQASIAAFIMLIDIGLNLLTIPEQKAILDIKEYAELQEAAKLIFKNRCAILGKKTKTKEHRDALCKARDLHSTTKGKKSIYNKELNKVKFVFETDLNLYLNNGWVLGGKPLTEDAKKKIGKGNSLALKGKKHQPIGKNKTNSGLEFNKVICIETGQIFENINIAKKWLLDNVGIDGGQIKNCCAGQRETTGGYHWQYYKGE